MHSYYNMNLQKSYIEIKIKHFFTIICNIFQNRSCSWNAFCESDKGGSERKGNVYTLQSEDLAVRLSLRGRRNRNTGRKQARMPTQQGRGQAGSVTHFVTLFDKLSSPSPIVTPFSRPKFLKIKSKAEVRKNLESYDSRFFDRFLF